MSRSTHTIRLQTGVALPYVQQGDPAGPPIIFLHGYSDTSRSFEPLLDHLPDSLHAHPTAINAFATRVADGRVIA